MGNSNRKRKFQDRWALQGGHKGKVVDLQWSQKGDSLVSVADDSTALVWRTGTWKKPQRIKLPGPYANSVDVSANRVVVAGTTKEIVVYSVGLEDPMYTLKGHTQGISCVRFNKNRKDVLLSGSLDGSIRMWDLVKKATSREFGSDSCTSCSKIAWCNGTMVDRLFLGAFEDTTVKLFDARKKKACAYSFSAHESDVNSVTWAPDDSYFASASSDSTVCLWDMKRPDKPFKTLRASPIKGDAIDVAIGGSSDSMGGGTFVYVGYVESPYLAVWPVLGSELAAVGRGNDVGSSSIPSKKSGARVRSRESAERRPSYMHPALSKRVTCVEVSPNGKYFATGDWGSNIIIWDIEKCKRSEWHTSGFYDIA
eukprot:g4632.t1